jgi:hypothetical protein
MGKESIPEISEDLNSLTRLSAREHCIENYFNALVAGTVEVKRLQ